MKTLRMLNRKMTKPRQNQYLLVTLTDRKMTSKGEESEKCGLCLQGMEVSAWRESTEILHNFLWILEIDWLVYCYEANCTMQWAEEHIRKNVCWLNSNLAFTTNTQIECS